MIFLFLITFKPKPFLSVLIILYQFFFKNEQKTRFARKNMCNLRKAFHVAKKMGTRVGGGEVLQRPL
jgi:hypothetical protein